MNKDPFNAPMQSEIDRVLATLETQFADTLSPREVEEMRGDVTVAPPPIGIPVPPAMMSWHIDDYIRDQMSRRAQKPADPMLPMHVYRAEAQKRIAAEKVAGDNQRLVAKLRGDVAEWRGSFYAVLLMWALTVILSLVSKGC